MCCMYNQEKEHYKNYLPVTTTSLSNQSESNHTLVLSVFELYMNEIIQCFFLYFWCLLFTIIFIHAIVCNICSFSLLYSSVIYEHTTIYSFCSGWTFEWFLVWSYYK